jgi:hypothetical protein
MRSSFEEWQLEFLLSNGRFPDAAETWKLFTGKGPDQTLHPDDMAVDRFASAMKAKLASQRAKGHGGWDNKDICSEERLQQMLEDHVRKGDPVDVGNLSMMLWSREESTAPTVKREDSQAMSLAPIEFKTVGEGIEVGFNLWGGVDIRLGGEFVYVHINYDHRYTSNAARAKLADDIVRLMSGKSALDPTPDMFWKAADSDTNYASIDELLNDEWCNGSIEVGETRQVMRALSLPNVTIKVTRIDDDSGDIEYAVLPTPNAHAPEGS